MSTLKAKIAAEAESFATGGHRVSYADTADRVAFENGALFGARALLEELREMKSQLQAIIETGKRDLTNPKYDSMFVRDELTKFDKLSSELKDDK